MLDFRGWGCRRRSLKNLAVADALLTVLERLIAMLDNPSMVVNVMLSAGAMASVIDEAPFKRINP